MLDEELSPVVAAALAQRQGERVEDALCLESARVAESCGRQTSELRGLSEGALLTRRAAGVAAGEEFAVTRELRRRRLEQLVHGSDPKTLKKAVRDEGKA